MSVGAREHQATGSGLVPAGGGVRGVGREFKDICRAVFQAESSGSCV